MKKQTNQQLVGSDASIWEPLLQIEPFIYRNGQTVSQK